MASNFYKALLDVLPQRPLQVGDVLSVSSGVCTVELPGGGIVRARGDASVSDRVFVRDGVIEGAAPSLTVVLIDV